MGANGIREAYAALPRLQDDPGQRVVVDRLALLQDRLAAARSPWRRLRKRLPLLAPPVPVRGLYLWGGVGRGKTFLMDLFYETLPTDARLRRHFHRMMGDVHRRLGNLGDLVDPLDRVAAEFAAEADVLCFDEFFVGDIGDAMILGRLLDGLFRRGVTLVATSNVPPADLYAGGLQRERFLPAIRLLEQFTQVVELDGSEDYRLRSLERAGTYLVPADAAADERLGELFAEVAPGRAETGRELEINGRGIATRRAARGVVWFDFRELCEGPRGTTDYVELARRYHTVLVSGVPELGAHHDDAARRFIALVDEFYDRRVKLALSAAKGATELYAGRRLAFEFQRTISRLSEMQSADYLHAAHRA